MAKKPFRRKKNSHPHKNLPIDIAIGIVGVLLIGFIYSLSQNTVHTGVPIKVKFPEIDSPKMLAKELYNSDPIKNIKVEILNGCGIKGIAAKTSEFLRSKHRIDVIRSDNAEYNNFNYHTKFRDNVSIEYMNNKIYSDKLDLDIKNSIAKIYENVKYVGNNGTIISDNIRFDLKTKKAEDFVISFEDYSGKKLSYVIKKTDIKNNKEWRKIKLPLHKFPIRKSKVDLTKIKQIHFAFRFNSEIDLDNIILTKK